MTVDAFGALGLAECGILKYVCIVYRGRFDFRRFHPVMVRGIDNSILFQNGQNKARFPGRLGKSVVEEKEGERIVGDEAKQDNALKHHRPCSHYVSYAIRYAPYATQVFERLDRF
jgi:hypothetical protein